MPREEDNRVGDKLINEVGSRAANYSPTRACRANLKRASQILSPPIQEEEGEGFRSDCRGYASIYPIRFTPSALSG